MKKIITYIITLTLVGGYFIPIHKAFASENEVQSFKNIKYVENNEIPLDSSVELFTPEQIVMINEAVAKVENLSRLPEDVRNDEIEKLILEEEGKIYTATDLMRGGASTSLKIVKSGLNFFASNKAGVSKLRSLMATGKGGAGTITTIAAALVKFAPSLTLKALTAILGTFSGYLTTKFKLGYDIVKKYDDKGKSKAGVRMTVFDVIDITNKGANGV